MTERKYDNTNTVIAYVENGLFARAGVENLQAQRKPILKLKVNVDGKDVEVALYFKMVYDEATGSFTNDYKLTSTGSKMLSGKVVEPYVANAVASVSEATSQVEEFDDEVPF